MAKYYWVGGTGTWDNLSSANWSLTPGGTGGAGVPSGADDVVFQYGTSGSGTVNVGSASCRNFECGEGNLLFLGAGYVTCYGILQLIAGNFIGLTICMSGTGSTSLTAYTPVGTLWLRGDTTTPYPEYDLATDLSVRIISTYYGTNPNVTPSVQAYLTINTNNHAINFVNYGDFDYNSKVIPTINLGSSLIKYSGQPADLQSISFFYPAYKLLNLSKSANSVNFGTAQIITNYTGATNFIGPSGRSDYSKFSAVTINVDTTATVYATTFNNLNIVSPSALGQHKVVVGDLIVNNRLVTSGPNPASRLFFNSATTPFAIVTATSVSLNNCDFRNIYASLDINPSPWSGVGLSDYNGNTNIIFDPPKAVYWNLVGSKNWSATGWALTSGGTPSVNNFPLIQDTAVVDRNSQGSVIYFDADYNIGSLDASDNQSIVFSHAGRINVYGNWSYSTNPSIGSRVNVSTTATAAVNFVNPNPGQYNVSTGLQKFPCAVFVNTSGTIFLSGNLVVDPANRSINLGSTYSDSGVNLVQGTILLNSYNLITPSFSSLNAVNSNTSILDMCQGNIQLFANYGAFWTARDTSRFTFIYSGTNVISSNATSVTFNGGGQHYPIFQLNTSSVVIRDSNTFDSITNLPLTVDNVTLTLGAGSTQQVGSFSVTGNSSHKITLNSSIAGSPAYMNLTTNSVVRGIDYLNIKDSHVTPAVTTWYAGAHSTNVSGNQGWIFKQAPYAGDGSFFLLFY